MVRDCAIQKSLSASFETDRRFRLDRCYPLLDLNLTRSIDRFLRLGLRDFDGKYTVLHLGCDLLLVDIVRQCECLLIVAVGELAAQILAGFLILFLAVVLGLGLLFEGDDKVVVVVDLDLEVVLGHTRSGNLDLVILLFVEHVDCRSSKVVLTVGHPEIVVKEIVEQRWEPILIIES